MNLQGPSLAKAPHLENPLPRNSEILQQYVHMFLEFFKSRCFVFLESLKSFMLRALQNLDPPLIWPQVSCLCSNSNSCHLLALWHWASYLTFFSLCLLFCKMITVLVFLKMKILNIWWDYYEDSMNHIKYLAKCLAHNKCCYCY